MVLCALSLSACADNKQVITFDKAGRLLEADID